MNRKGETVVSEAIVKMLISVLVLGALIAIFTILYFVFVAENDSRQTIEQMDKLEEIIKRAERDSDGEKHLVEFFPSQKDNWKLRILHNPSEFPTASCIGNKVDSCVCACKNSDCGGERASECRGFDFRVIGSTSMYTNYDGGYGIGSGTTVGAPQIQEGGALPYLSLSESVYEFEAVKKGDEVILSRK